MESNCVLVFAPHPDDDILGCAGSICKHLTSGTSVKIVYMTDGEKGVRGVEPCKAARIRRQEVIAALKHIGNVETQYLGLEDGLICESEEIIIKIVDIIRKVKPKRIYLPHENDRHLDHQKTYHIVLNAVRFASILGTLQCEYKDEWQVEEIWCYEVWTPIMHVDFAVDITEFIEQKTLAMREHKSQIEKRAYDEAILGLNHYRGIILNTGKYCEAFKVLRLAE